MELTMDYSDVQEGGLLPAGEYEAIIKYAGEDTTKSGTVHINVTMVIRNDVEQQCKNKYIWHKLWHRKSPSPADVNCGGYSSKQIMKLSKVAGLPNGRKYESLADWCEELGGKCVRITVEHEEYNGEKQAKVRWVNEPKTRECRHEWKEREDEQTGAAPAADGFAELGNNDDELPF